MDLPWFEEYEEAVASFEEAMEEERAKRPKRDPFDAFAKSINSTLNFDFDEFSVDIEYTEPGSPPDTAVSTVSVSLPSFHSQEGRPRHHPPPPPHPDFYDFDYDQDFFDDMDFDLEDLTRDQAKDFAHYFITYIILSGMTCGICLYSLVCSCCLCAIGKAKRSQKIAEQMTGSQGNFY